MRSTLLALALAAALPAARAGDSPRILVIRASRYDKGDGKGLRRGPVRLLVSQGKILALQPDRGPLPQGSRVVASAPVLIPGLVAAATDLDGAPREKRPVTPDYRASRIRITPEEARRFLRGGITAFHASPGRSRFLPGLGALFSPRPGFPSAALLSPAADLLLVLGDMGKMLGTVFDPVVFPDETHLLKPARRMMPSSLAGQAFLARRLFALASRPGKKAPLLREGRREWSLEPLKAAARGKIPVRFVCDSAASVRTALLLAKELKLRALIEDLRPGGGDPSEFSLWKPAAVIVRIPLHPWGPAPGDPARTRPSRRPDPSYPARLHAAGIPVVLAPASDGDAESLLLAAGAAVRAGLPPGAALRALTLEPARALGAEKRIGSLEAGKEADFLLLSDDPFLATTSLLSVYLRGEPARIRPAGSEPLLAVRAGRVHLGDGRVLRPGTILVRKGKIAAAGKNLALPPGTKLLDLPAAVVTPGFLDADSRLGLPSTGGNGRTPPLMGGGPLPRSRGTRRFPRLGPEADPALLVRPGGPGFREALRAGVTAVLVAGEGRAGRGVLYKTAVEKAPLANPAALHYPLSSPRGLQARLAGAEAFLKKLEAWKKAYGEWRKKRFGPASRPAKPFRPSPGEAPAASGKKASPTKGEKKPAAGPAGKKPAEPAPPKGSADPVSGVWKGTVSGLPGGRKAPFILRLRLKNGKVTGIFQGPFRFRKGAPPVIPLLGKYQEGKLDLRARTRSGQILFEIRADLSGDELEGTWVLLGGRMKGALRGRRERKPGAPAWEEPPRGGPEVILEEVDDDVDLSELVTDPDLGDVFAPLPPLPPPGPAAAAQADPVSGTWKGEILGIPGMGRAPFSAELSLSGSAVTGSVKLPFHRRGGPSAQPVQGTFSGGVLRMTGKRMPIRMEATVEKDRMEGNWSLGPFKGTFTAERTSKARSGGEKTSSPSTKESDEYATGAPKRPVPGPSLEPWIDVLQGRTTLILHPSGAEALRETLAYLASKRPGIRIVVADGKPARESLKALAEAKAAVLVEPGSDPGPLGEGPAAYARAGVAVLFGSGSAEGTRWLPIHAAWAVSRGMDPEEALRSLTSRPAARLGLGERLGSLLPGRDADLLIWTGDPFDLKSRISTVIVSGKVVFQSHE